MESLSTEKTNSVFSTYSDKRVDIENQQDYSSGDKKNKHFFGRCISSVFMVIPQLIMHIGLGALKGIEVSISGSVEFFNSQAKRIGEEGGKFSNFCGHAGTFAGVIVGIVVAVPSLLLGTVFGIIKGICNIHDAVKTCLSHGCSEAVYQTADIYNIDQRKITVIAATAALLVASVLICLPIAVTSGPAFVLIPALLSWLGSGALAYIFATRKKESIHDGEESIYDGASIDNVASIDDGTSIIDNGELNDSEEAIRHNKKSMANNKPLPLYYKARWKVYAQKHKEAYNAQNIT